MDAPPSQHNESRTDIETEQAADANTDTTDPRSPDAGLSDTAGDRLRQLGVMAHHEYRLSLRNRWAAGLTLLIGGFATMLVWFGGSNIGPTRSGPLIASLASLATYLLPLAGLMFGHTLVVGDDERGWLSMLFALPTPRWLIIVGKYLGRAVTLSAATAIGFGVAGVALGLRLTGAFPAGIYATVLVASVGVGLAFLSLGTVISTLSPSRTHALGGSLLVWLWFVFVHDLVALGIIAAFDVGGQILSVFVFLNPTTSYRVLVLRIAGTQGGAFAAVFAETVLTTSLLVWTLLAWLVLPLVVATFVTSDRLSSA
ncbi:MAG: ABC transporter permease [Halorientalis sp.]